MSDTFQKTVNLKEKQVLNRPVQPLPPKREQPSRAQEVSERKKSEAMDKIFGDEKNDIQKISRGGARRNNGRLTGVVLGIISFAIGALVFQAWLGDDDRKIDTGQTTSDNVVVEQWYSIKLVNGEVYYGQIGDIKADPVMMRNVYYDYDMLNKKEETAEGEEKPAQGGLRLVKRGKESYGPDGTISIVRAQVMFFEPLKEESKVLKAILENEGK